MKIGVLGSSGFLGTNLVSVLKNKGYEVVLGSRKAVGYENVDAKIYESVYYWIVRNNITHVINCAAECGGIGLNKKYPFKLWANNSLINTNVLSAAVDLKIEKLIMLGTVCSYSKNTPVPFKEEYLMSFGFPEETNAAYGVTKLSSLFGAVAANSQTGLNVMNLIPVNMYGPHDHFSLDNSHVIPAIIRKIDDAINNNLSEITLWGDGSASREFLHVRDCAEAIIKALEHKEIYIDFLNVGVGEEITIKNLVNIIVKIMNYNGKIIWNSNQPNGQQRRCLNVDRINKLLGWKAEITLQDGLAETIEWYKHKRNI